MHGLDDQVVPFELSGQKSADLLQNCVLKTYEGFPHGMPTTEAETAAAVPVRRAKKGFSNFEG